MSTTIFVIADLDSESGVTIALEALKSLVSWENLLQRAFFREKLIMLAPRMLV